MSTGKLTNLKGFGCSAFKTKDRPFGVDADAYNSLLCLPFCEFELTPEVETVDTKCGSCTGEQITTERITSTSWNLTLRMQDCIDDFTQVGALMNQRTKAEASSDFFHVESLDVDVTAGTAASPYITAADTDCVYVTCGANPGPKAVVAAAPLAGEVRVADGLITLNAADLVDCDGNAIDEQKVCILHKVTATDTQYIGADAEPLGQVAYYGVVFGQDDQKMPIYIPCLNMITPPTLALGGDIPVMEMNYSLEIPSGSGWRTPWKMWSNACTWDFGA